MLVFYGNFSLTRRGDGHRGAGCDCEDDVLTHTHSLCVCVYHGNLNERSS